jgi:hypothetical protein
MGAYTIAHNAQNGQAQDASKDCGWIAHIGQAQNAMEIYP